MLTLLSALALAAVPDIDTPLKNTITASTDAAVVIGIERYGFLAPVPHASRDARAMYHLLAYTRGIPLDQIELLSGGNREQILEAVSRARSKLGPKGTLWVVFAGHGATSPDTGELLLVGDDAKTDPSVFVARSVPVSLLGKETVLMLDTCWAGRGRDGSELLPGTRFAVPSYATPTSSGGASVVAAKPGQVSVPYGPAEHGLFTYFLTGALRGWADGEIDGTRDGQITLKEAYQYTARALATVHPSGQQPMWTGDDRIVVSAAPGVLEAGPDLGLLPKVGEPQLATPALVGSTQSFTPIPVPTVSLPQSISIAKPLHWGDGGELIDAKGRVHNLSTAISNAAHHPGLTRAWQAYQLDATARVYGGSMMITGTVLAGAMVLTGVSAMEGGALYFGSGAAMGGAGAALFTYGVAHRKKSRQKLLDVLNTEPE